MIKLDGKSAKCRYNFVSRSRACVFRCCGFPPPANRNKWGRGRANKIQTPSWTHRLNRNTNRFIVGNAFCQSECQHRVFRLWSSCRCPSPSPLTFHAFLHQVSFLPYLINADPTSRVVNPDLQTDPVSNGVYFRCMRVYGAPKGGTRTIVAE